MNQKSAFGLSQIDKEQPQIAVWLFRGYFIISKAIVGWLAATKLIPPTDLYEVVISITLLGDPIMFGFSKMFGIVPVDAQPGQPLIADTQIQDGEPKTIKPVVVDGPVNPVKEPGNAPPPTTWPIPAKSE